MQYHIRDNDDAIDRTYGAPSVPQKIERCELCGTDRFVRVLKNGGRICLGCQDDIAAAAMNPAYDLAVGK